MRFFRPLTILATLALLLASARLPLHAAFHAFNARFDNEGVPQADPAPAAADRRPLLVCFGDSLTAGAGVLPDEAYPAYLQQRLDEKGFHYRVVNAGVSGDTTKDGIQRLAGVLKQRPQIVVVEFGGNDGLRGLPIAQAERNLEQMVRQLKAGGSKVALAGITLPPQYGGEYIHSFNAMFPTVANKFHIPLLPFVLQDAYGVPGDIQEDGIHATAQGNKQVALNVEKLVSPLLKK